jgi:hypothetical protein
MNNSNDISDIECMISEEMFNIFRDIAAGETSNTRTFDNFNDYSSNNNRNNTTFFNIVNDYNMNIQEYNSNIREYIIRQNNSTEYVNNINEYNSNISDYNSNIHRFLDLMININNRNNARENRRHFIRPNTSQYRERTNTNSYAGLRGLYTYTPTQLLSYFWPNRTFTNVIVRPTNAQITEATQILTYNENEHYNNNSCPITMEEFNNGEQLFQIRQCGHNFREDALRNWFRTNVRCPVCRYDIRDYRTNVNASNNVVNDISENTEDDDNNDENNDNSNNNNENTNNENIDISGNISSTRPTNNRFSRIPSNNLSNIIENYVTQHITPFFVENMHSNLSDTEVILPIVYYTDAFRNYRYSTMNTPR